MNVFVDTSFFVAVAMKRDQWHERALRAVRPEMSLLTSSLVVNETVSLLQARGRFSEALLFLREIRANGAVEILYPDPAVQSQAWEEFPRRGAAGANAVDCVSFALMRKFSIRDALTFDQHFRAAGFNVRP
jgi:predicted nucleic acid-binding protein